MGAGILVLMDKRDTQCTIYYFSNIVTFFIIYLFYEKITQTVLILRHIFNCYKKLSKMPCPTFHCYTRSKKIIA